MVYKIYDGSHRQVGTVTNLTFAMNYADDHSGIVVNDSHEIVYRAPTYTQHEYDN